MIDRESGGNVMVKKIALILGAVLLLASCDPGTGLLAFFSASSFPAHLGLVEKVVDLSDKIDDHVGDDGCHNCNHVHFLGGYVFLAAKDSQLLIFNEDLQLIRRETNEYAYGTMGFTDGGTFFLGGYDYANDPPHFTRLALPSLYPQRYGFGFFDTATAEKFAVNQDGQMLELYRSGMFDQNIDLRLTANMKDWRFSSFAYDESVSPNSVFFFEEDYSDRDIKAIFMDSSAYTQAGYFSELTAQTPEDFPEAEDGRYYYTRYHDDSGSHPGFVGIWNGTMRLVDSGGHILSSLSGYKTERMALAFDSDGRFFYLYDADQKALFRCRTWWSK